MGGGRCGHVCSRQTVPVHVELSFSLSSYEFPFLGLEEVRNGHRQGKRARVERAPSRSPRQAVSEGPSWWLPWERESQEETGSISSAVWPGATSQDTTLLGPCTLRKEASCWDHREQVNCCGSGLTVGKPMTLSSQGCFQPDLSHEIQDKQVLWIQSFLRRAI